MSSIEFDFPSDLSPFPKQTQDLLRMAHALGWKMRWQGSNKNIVQIISPTESSKMIAIPRTNLNDNRHRSTVRQIARYSDRDSVLDYVDSKVTVRDRNSLRVTLDLGPEPTRSESKTALAAAMGEAQARKSPPLGDVKAAENVLAAAQQVRAAEQPVSRTRDTAPPRVAQFRGGDTSVTLVSETPWMVRRGGQDGGKGRMYESPHVLHRVWSDGGEDYRCRYCEYSGSNPRGVSSHVSRRKDHPSTADAARHTLLTVEHYEPTEIKRPTSAIRRLRTEMLHALDTIEGWREMDPEVLAEQVAEAIYMARPDREPTEPLTAEQIISRITMLVDAGRLAEMHQQVEAAAEALRVAKAEVDASVARAEEAERVAEALRQERKALRELLSEEGVSA